jgi:hypothetical protein
LKAISDRDIRKGCPADELFVVEVDQIDVEMIGSLGVGEAEYSPICECWKGKLTACRCVKRPMRLFFLVTLSSMT